MSLITQWISPLYGQTHLFCLIALEKFTHKILFQGPRFYTCLCILKNKIVSNQFQLISINFNGLFLHNICGHETDGNTTHHIKIIKYKNPTKY